MNGLYLNLIKQKTLKDCITFDYSKYNSIVEFDNLFLLLGDTIRVVTKDYDLDLNLGDIDFSIYNFNGHLIVYRNNILEVPFYRRELLTSYMVPPIEFFKYYKVCKEGIVSEEI